MRSCCLLLLLAACSEVGFTNKADPEGTVDTAAPTGSTPTTPEGTPDLRVTPREIALLDACTFVEDAVELESVGTAPVVIEAVVLTGDGWDLQADAPTVLEPGETATLPLLGASGVGELSIQSNDADEPLVRVTLAVAIQEAPELTWGAPEDRAEIAGPDPVMLSVDVWDDATAPEDLVVTFTSDLDGELAEVTAAADGTASFEWAPPRSPGLHTLTATVTDSCGFEAEGVRYVTDLGVPDIDVVPGLLELENVCGAIDESVTVLNVGSGTLIVHDVRADGDWTTPGVPFELAPGDALDVPVRSDGGVGTLFLDSNDPDEARVEVPLSSTPDSPPIIVVDAPLPGGVLAELGDVELLGSAIDDVDAAVDLQVTWSSDIDGLIADDPPAPDATLRSVWPEPRTLGPHTVTLEVTDSCGNVSRIDVPVEQPGLPDIEITPMEVVGEACPMVEERITVSNVGTGDLVLSSAVVLGWGWPPAPPHPAVLAPGDSWDFPLASRRGEATLQVDSNDPDEPRVEVPLVAERDLAPTVSITGPLPDTIVSSGTLLLEGEVSDDVDAPESLTVEWTSDVDGLIGSLPASPAGLLSQPWGEPRTGGDHTLTLDAWDSCGNHSSAVVGICQDEIIRGDELDLEDWTFAGVASWDEVNEWIELTPVVTFEVGSAFATHETVSGGDVEIDFSFYMGDGSGADGFSLTMLDTGRTMRTLGGDGGCLGYGEGAVCTGAFLPGWSIEVDTYFNGWDPTGYDHVAFSFDGGADAPEAWSTLPEMEDTGWHSMHVEVSAPHVYVTIDGVPYIDQDIPGFYDFEGWVGFTASTGGSTNKHLIDALEVVDHLCE